MIHTATIFVPRAVLKFTKEEVDLMMKCSARHYDGHCKAVGRVGGFLYGIYNRYSWSDDPEPEITLTFREIDTLAKVVEPVLPGSTAEVKLYWALITVLRHLN